MLCSDGSEIAEPQKDMLSLVSFGNCSASTSVAVSERAQQKDYDVRVVRRWTQEE